MQKNTLGKLFWIFWYSTTMLPVSWPDFWSRIPLCWGGSSSGFWTQVKGKEGDVVKSIK